MTAQLLAIFAFGLVMTGVVYLGVLRAREVAERTAKVRAATAQAHDATRRSPSNHLLRKAS